MRQRPMSKITIKQGGLLDATEDVICHQVNCLGIMRRGIAKQIKEAYPQVFKRYYDVVSRSSSPKELLGQILMDEVDQKEGSQLIISLFGQLCFGSEQHYTNYAALGNAVFLMFEAISHIGVKSIAIPYGIGCGLDGGGNWEIVKEIFELYSDKFNIPVVAYKLD